MRRFCYTLVVAVLSLVAAEYAISGALDFVIDLDTPASAVSPNWQSEPIDARSGVAFGLGYSSRAAFAPGGSLRFGVVAGRRSLRASAASSYRDGHEYTEFRLQGRAIADVLRRKRVVFSAELALGLSFMSDDIPCNEMFCELPESVTIATLAAGASVRLSSRTAVVASIRYPAYLTDWQSTFPFKSGLVVGLGLEVAGPGGE